MIFTRRRVSLNVRSMKLGCRCPLVVLDGEPQVGGQTGQIVVEAGDRGGELSAVGALKVWARELATAIDRSPGGSPVESICPERGLDLGLTAKLDQLVGELN